MDGEWVQYKEYKREIYDQSLVVEVWIVEGQNVKFQSMFLTLPLLWTAQLEF